MQNLPEHNENHPDSLGAIGEDSPYSEAADYDRRNHEDPLREARGCVFGLVIIALFAGGVWIWRGL